MITCTRILPLVCVTTWIITCYAAVEQTTIRPNWPHDFITIRLPDFCPKTERCPDGVHILCVFDPYFGDRLGPRCNHGRNITLSERNKNDILTLTNNIRGRVATGVETGMDGVVLRRAYNMPQLDWDYQLAAFAQILANQCTFKHDMCRATYQFSDPGQAIGLLRFTYPDWDIISETGGRFNEFDQLVEHSIEHIIKRWYRQKLNVTNAMITKSPIGSRRQLLQDLSGYSIYLQMVSGKSTHIGCGVSAYTMHASAEQYYNVIHLVCNFSYKPKLNEYVYELRKANDDECGCKGDVGHSEDCLCHIYYPKRLPEPETTTQPEPETTTEPEPETTTEPKPETTTEPEPETTSKPKPEPKPEPVPLPTLHIIPIIVTGNDSDENLVHNKPARRYQSETEIVQPMVGQTFSKMYYDADYDAVDYGEENFEGDTGADGEFYVAPKDLDMHAGDSNRERYVIYNNDYTQSDFFQKRRPVRRFHHHGQFY